MFNYSNISILFENNYRLDSANRLMDRNEIKVLFGIIMGTLCLITTIGNLCVIYRYRKASMVGNLFIISLACADLIVGCVVMPLATVYAITEIWTMTLSVCQIWLSADYTASTASILNLLTLSLDRYWSITSPLKYLGLRTKSRALIMISIAWSLSLLWLVPIIGWPYFFNGGVRHVPEDKCNTEYDKNILFKTAAAIVNFYIPLFAMISINTKIYMVIRKRYHSPIMKYSSVSTSFLKSVDPNNQTGNNRLNRIQSKSSQSSYNFANANASSQNLCPSSYNNNNNNNNNNNARNSNKNTNDINIKSDRSNSEIQLDKATKNTKMPITDAEQSSFRLSNTKSILRYFTNQTNILDSNKGSLTKKDKNSLKNLNNDDKNFQPNKYSNFQQISKFQNSNSSNYLDIKFNSKNSNRSITSQIRANRNIPSNSLKMSKFLHESTDQKLSPLFFNKSSSLKIFNYKSNYLFESESDSEHVIKDKEEIIKNKKNNSTENLVINSISSKNDEYNLNNSKTNINHGNSFRSSIRQNGCKKNQTNASNILNETSLNFSNKKAILDNPNKDKLENKVMDFTQSKTKIQQQQKDSNRNKGFMSKQEKAFKQLAAIVIGFTLCFLPYFTIFLIVAFCENCISDDVFTASVWLGYLNSTINPFLYALSDRRLFNKKSKNRKIPTVTNTEFKTNTEVRIR